MNREKIKSLIDELNEIAKRNDIVINDIVVSYKDIYECLSSTVYEKKLYEMRSLSKFVVALCYGKLLYDEPQNLLFDIDTPVWPKILESDKRFNLNLHSDMSKVTVRHLLTQSAGYDNPNFLMSGHENVSEDKYLELLINKTIDFLPGTKFVYSNAAYYLLSVFYQKLYGENLYIYAKEKIFKPLGILESKWQQFGEYCAGATGLSLYSEDFHKIARLVVDNGECNGKPVVNQNYVQEMMDGKIDIPDNYKSSYFKPVQYGYSFWITDDLIRYVSGANGKYFIVDTITGTCITILGESKSIRPILEHIHYWIKANR